MAYGDISNQDSKTFLPEKSMLVQQGVHAVAIKDTSNSINHLSDTVDLKDLTAIKAFQGASLYVGSSGDIKVNMAGTDNTVVFKEVQAGTFLPIKVNRVWSTSTTADFIVALY
tara:strand:+ start:1162 stop:1500 length:339 start_codon:yes stop_codon:yes gene_type:complete